MQVPTLVPTYEKVVGQPGDYYNGIDMNATNDVLKGQLQELIFPHTALSYDDVWTAFESVDRFLPTHPCNEDQAMIPDIYSGYCWHSVKGLPTGGECGNFQKEGDCYNREHIWPKSWFGGFDAGQNAQTDLFELWPSDGYVNGLRGNLPLGYVKKGTETYISTNFSRIGTCLNNEAMGKCFEIADLYKGDVARSYFYLTTAYWNKWSCCDDVGNNGSDMKSWMENEMREWHANDPVDTNEMMRNDQIQLLQGNRNPYIDHPEFVSQIDNF